MIIIRCTSICPNDTQFVSVGRSRITESSIVILEVTVFICKVEFVDGLINDSDKLAFVGDGINDSLSIKGADIGISMGNLGSNIAIEASDVVIMNDDISKLITGIKISKYTNRIVLENLIFSLFIKLLILVLSSLGIASMIFCVFADTGLTLLTIINTIRIRLKKY